MPINIVPKQSEEDNERDAREAAVAGPLKAPKKRIVTKEEMKKEGYDNLRDYLNFKQGKVRRKDKNTDIITKGATKLYEERMGPDTAVLDRGAAAVKKIKADEAAAKNKSADRPGSEVLTEKMEKGQPKMQGAYREAFGNIRKALGFKKGGNVESKLMGKEGRGMAKATMQKVASKAVKAHESRMHKAKSGSSVSKRADGAAIRGKTRGRMM